MHSFYDFQAQINALRHIFQEHVTLSQSINVFLKKMPKAMVLKIVSQLKDQYEKQYNNQGDQQKSNAVKSTLNLVRRQQATNLDSLFIELAQEINGYYKKQYFNIKKEVPFVLSCDICSQYVANDHYGREIHKSKCRKKNQDSQEVAPQRKTYKKLSDTIQKYWQRRNLVIQQTLNQNIAQNSKKKKKESSQQCYQKQSIKDFKRVKNTKKHKISKKHLKSISSNLSDNLLTKFNQKNHDSFDEQLSHYFQQNSYHGFQFNENNQYNSLQQLLGEAKQHEHNEDSCLEGPAFNENQMHFKEEIYNQNDDEFLGEM